MNDLGILSVQIIKRIEQLITPRENLIWWEGPLLALHHLIEVVSGNKLHHQKLSFTFRKMIADAR